MPGINYAKTRRGNDLSAYNDRMNPEGHWPQPLRLPSDTGTPSGEQSDEEKIPYSAARNIRGGSLILRKQYSEHGWRRMVDEELAGATPEIRAAMYRPSLPGRIPNHLLRLLSRKGPEYDFGKAMLTHGPSLFKENNRESSDDMNQVMSSEYADTIMWWTFAPYLYKSLRNKGVEEKDAVRKIMEWSKTSKTTTGELRDLDAISKLSLAGLEVFSEESVERYALTQDQNDLSHKFTEQEAERVLKDAFGIEGKSK